MICTGLTSGFLSNVAQREWSTGAASEACTYVGNYEELYLETNEDDEKLCFGATEVKTSGGR